MLKSGYQALSELIHANETLLWSIGGISLLAFICTLIVIPWMVVKIPVDYFSNQERHGVPWGERHPLIRYFLLLAKNLLGGSLIILGLAMLVLPGQGLMSMLIGILLIDFPGKFRFERWLIQRGPILRTVNWLREKRGHPPLEF